MKESLSKYVFASKYPKWIKGENRRETFTEAVSRVMEMHERRFPHLDFSEVTRLYKEKVIAGSQRALQFGGAAIEEKEARIYNCCVSYCDRPSFFRECMWLLLCGCGTGISFQEHHVANLPAIKKPRGVYYHLVEDSIEGWANAADAQVKAYMLGTALPSFDFSQIRPEGTPLRHGGYAPSYKPLKKALSLVHHKLKECVGRKLRPIEAFDLTMYLADAVISGGIRRSATIGVFTLSDTEMLEAKTGDWISSQPQRGRANISAMITPEVKKEDFLSLFSRTREYGEPAFIFSKSSEYLYNPCVEVGMIPLLIKYKGEVVENYSLDLVDPKRRYDWTDKGYIFDSGWQMCNLSTVNCAKIKTEEEFYTAISAASMLGTIQASYTDFRYLGEVSTKICKRESLLGVSMTGILSNEMFYTPSILMKGKREAIRTNERIAAEINIPVASRVCVVKPEGTASIVLGSSAGIHPYHAKRYIRRVQASMYEPLYQEVRKTHPSACKTSFWGMEVIAFPCEAPPEAMVKRDLTATGHLDIVKIVNQHWILDNNPNNRTEGLSHNVSITVSVADHEWEGLQEYIWENREYFTGIALLSASGDYEYPDPPYQEVFSPQEISSDDPFTIQKLKMWELYQQLTQLPEIDLEGVFESKDNTTFLQEPACASGICDLEFIMEKKEC